MSWKGIITSNNYYSSNFIYISTNQNLMTKQEITLSGGIATLTEIRLTAISQLARILIKYIY